MFVILPTTFVANVWKFLSCSIGGKFPVSELVTLPSKCFNICYKFMKESLDNLLKFHTT